MSKQQWGHGYNTGHADGSLDGYCDGLEEGTKRERDRNEPLPKEAHHMGHIFALAVADQAERVFSDVSLTAVPESLRAEHMEIRARLAKYRTELIQAIDESASSCFSA